MIVFNWPDECPKCGCREFYASNTKSISKLTGLDGTRLHKETAFIHNRINFNCRDEECGAAWVHQLEGADPYILIAKDDSPPLAVFAESPEAAVNLLALDGDWDIRPFRSLQRAGASRVRLVRESIEEAARADDS